jgi:hypothetical protein
MAVCKDAYRAIMMRGIKDMLLMAKLVAVGANLSRTSMSLMLGT